MQYYTEHEINIYPTDICIEYDPLNKTIQNNRALPKDIVYIRDKIIIHIKERCKNPIVGILYIDSNIKYGHYKNILLYRFQPTDHHYPTFYVPYHAKKGLHKIYISILLKEWKTTDKFPIGTCIEQIGNVGNEEAEYEHLRHYYQLVYHTWKIDRTQEKKDEEYMNYLQTQKEDYCVFSIDPEGSKDIDDAFHFRKIEESNIYEVGIHIASPSFLLEKDVSRVMERVSTIYLPYRKYNMLPNRYADEWCSLLEQKKRHALSILFHFDSNYQLVSKEIRETIVLNVQQDTYEHFEKYYSNDPLFQSFMAFSNYFFSRSLDSHQLVEEWMIYTNQQIADSLLSMSFSNVLLRKHLFTTPIENNNQNSVIHSYINMRNEKSALYDIYDPNATESQTHSKLKNQYYTHFTSPIRRSIDFAIHIMLRTKKDLYTKEEWMQKIEHINHFIKKSRKLDRNCKRLNFLFRCKQMDHNIQTDGYILEINEYSILVYIPEYHLEEKITIVPKKFRSIQQSISMPSYTLYQKLSLRLWVFPSFDSFFEKLQIEICTL